MLQSLCNSTTNVKKTRMVHNKLRLPVTVLCRKMSAKKVPELYTTSHVCLYYAAKFMKKSTRMVHNRLRLPVTVLCSKISNKKYQNGTKRQFKLKILS